ncbi:hypothetical protein M8009_10365 [Halomonas sp. ATCH28]|uniref:Uncharacterized protein n=1 Tax=Halomonas gemina TaxID=2945105 RepID=A0ABT0T1A4_9GAMM|nr:hypothetical protein [Halomonas gemina]MCL7940693.1 hypothetical protein [Halomonas gemina]
MKTTKIEGITLYHKTLRGKLEMYTYRERLNFAKTPGDELHDRVQARLSREGINAPTALDFERAQVAEMKADPDLAARYHNREPANPLHELGQELDDAVDDAITARAYKIAREQGVTFKAAVEAVMRENPDLQQKHATRFTR